MDSIKIEEREVYSKYTLKNVYCVNCGERGHVLRECNGPVTSFGIIAFKTCNNDEDCKYDTNPVLKEILSQLNIIQDNMYPKIKFLMIQRKDTMGYIDFVRGKYDSKISHEKDKKLQICLDEMTKKEKENLLLKDFDTIWDDLWVNHDSKCFKNEYELAKKKFNNLNIKNLINKSTTTYKFQEFGFPKGKRHMQESIIMCAEREFREETGYDKSCYDFIKNYPIIKEEFVGTNNVAYRHIYYLVKIKDGVHAPKIDLHNKIQIGEVRNIGWFTLEECLNLIRPYDIAKKSMIKSVAKDILNMNQQYNCSNIFIASNNVNSNTFKQNMKNIYAIITDLYNNSEQYLIDTDLN